MYWIRPKTVSHFVPTICSQQHSWSTINCRYSEKVKTSHHLISVYSQVVSYLHPVDLGTKILTAQTFWLFLFAVSFISYLPYPPLLLKIWGKTTTTERNTRDNYFFGPSRNRSCNAEGNCLSRKSTYHHKSVFNFTGGLQQSDKHLLPASPVDCPLNKSGPRPRFGSPTYLVTPWQYLIGMQCIKM